MEEQQQQRRTIIHPSILNGIARLENPQHREERHMLNVGGIGIVAPPVGRQSLGFRRYLMDRVDRRSLQYLVDFLDGSGDSHELVITELVLNHVHLVSDPSPDGGLDILRTFFSRSDTTVTKVRLDDCTFGSAQEASQLIGAFQTNTTVTDLVIRHIANLTGTALGNCLSGLSQNMPQLQRLGCNLHVEGIRAFQPALQANRALKELSLPNCRLGDDGIRIIADALVGNTTIEILDFRYNEITSNGLDDITRLLESTRLNMINLEYNRGSFNVEASTQRFASVLSRHEFLKELNLSHCGLGDKGIHLIADGLVGNTIMQVLGIKWNGMTYVGLADITRLLESTLLQKIDFRYNGLLFDDEDATLHFAVTLHKNTTVQELRGIAAGELRDAAMNIYARNKNLILVNLLLAPPLPQQSQQQRNTAGTMMLKISHKAIAKFAMALNNVGASAIFKLFQARPQLLEKRIKRPVAAAAFAVSTDCSTTSNSIQASSSAAFIQTNKRRRL